MEELSCLKNQDPWPSLACTSTLPHLSPVEELGAGVFTTLVPLVDPPCS